MLGTGFIDDHSEKNSKDGETEAVSGKYLRYAIQGARCRLRS